MTLAGVRKHQEATTQVRVDTHAKGVRRGDCSQFTAVEAGLDVLLGSRRQLRVEITGGCSLRLEKLRDLFGITARGAVDDHLAQHIG